MEGNDVISRHLRSSAELLLLVPIRPGFVPVSELCSYANRLHIVLDALFELRKLAIERDGRALKGPVERLQTIHRVQWTVLHGPNRTESEPRGEPALLVTAHFDRSWEDYFQLLVDINGPLLDLIFSHCEDFKGFSCEDGFDRFAEYIRKYQRPCDFLYAANPELTVDDLRYFEKRSTRGSLEPGAQAAFSIGTASAEADAANAALPYDRIKQGMRDALIALHDVRKRFFDYEEPELEHGSPGLRDRSGQVLYDDAIRALIKPELEAQNLIGELEPELPVEVASWARSLVAAVAPPARPVPALPTADDLAQIQGNIVQGYSDMTDGCAVLVRCDGPTAMGALLRQLQGQVTTQAGVKPGQTCINVALTYAGLERMGLRHDVLARFPKEFREGMEERAGLLGDVGVAHPARWNRPELNWPLGTSGEPIALSAVDLVVIVQAPRGATAPWPQDTVLRDLRLDDPDAGRRILHVQTLQRDGSNREHFGFSEGEQTSSQPRADFRSAGLDLVSGQAASDLVPPGELILGFANGRGKIAACADLQLNPHSAVLFKNGSFMAMRKLQQNVEQLEDYATACLGAKAKATATEVKEHFVGRKLDGTPLVATQTAPTNAFTFAGDGDGKLCPLHAHVRLANPRVPATDGRPSTPRIARRGFSYGPRYVKGAADAGVKRGLLFMAYNASLAGQYEVIQRWLNAGNATGLLSANNDLLASTLPHTNVPRSMQVGDEQLALPPRSTPFVSLQWGMYLFAPSKAALSWLADQTALPTEQAKYQSAVERGRKTLSQLNALAHSDADAAAREWKNLLEEPSNFEHASDVWFAIHAGGGTLHTPYGVLVANAETAQLVLADRGKMFSVREYDRRLGETTGPHYLAIDPEPGTVTRGDDFDDEYEQRFEEGSYESLAQTFNQHLGTLTLEEAYAAAYGYARKFLLNPGTFEIGGEQGYHRVRVRDLASVVVARLARDWLGLPGADDDQVLVESLDRFVRTSRYTFQPSPEESVQKDVTKRVTPAELREQYRLTGKLAEQLRGEDVQRVLDGLIGAVVGFAAPAIGCIFSVVDLWTEEHELAAIAQLARVRLPAGDSSPEVQLKAAAQARMRVTSALLTALVRRPVPATLYRTAADGAHIGAQTIAAGTKVIVSLSAAMLDTHMRDPSDADAWRWLFGGAHGSDPSDGKPPHGCPARQAALGVLVGTVMALLEQPELERKRRGVLAYRAP